MQTTNVTKVYYTKVYCLPLINNDIGWYRYKYIRGYNTQNYYKEYQLYFWLLHEYTKY